MTVKPYPEYKTSELGWLGQVPAGWSVEPLRNVTSFTTGWTPSTSIADSYDGDLLWANISDLGPKYLSSTAKRLSAEAIAASRIPLSPRGSLLFSFKLTIGSVSIVHEDMYTNEAIATFYPSKLLSIGFAYYALPVCVVRNASENIYGAPMLNARLIRSARVVVPPVDEQRQIADYLDTQTAKIDALIAKQERLIETLAERRQAVISHAVTKGLDPNATMKDSGHRWVGSIPVHWTPVPFIRLTLGRVDYRGATPTKTTDGVQLITARNVKKGYIDREAAREYVSVEDYAEVMRRGIPEVGDLLLTMEAPLGNVALVDDRNIALAQRVIMFRLDRSKISPEFASYLLNGFQFQEQILSKATGSTALGLKASKLIELHVAVPPIPEQSAIVAYLDRETSRIDALSAKAREMIDVLKERRQALISAAVTGKIDVRGLA